MRIVVEQRVNRDKNELYREGTGMRMSSRAEME
jgi:hypothetical protein